MDDILTLISYLATAGGSDCSTVLTIDIETDLVFLSKHSQHCEYTVSGAEIGNRSYLLYLSVSTAPLLLRYVTVHYRLARLSRLRHYQYESVRYTPTQGGPLFGCYELSYVPDILLST